jgi:hypothetical protein
VLLSDKVHFFESEYLNVFFNFLYYTSTAIQGWVFATRYLSSAVECSLQKTHLTTECVKHTGWGVGLAFLTTLTVLSLSIMITFPGYYDSNGSMDQGNDWFDGVGESFTLSSTTIWTALTITSTITTIYAIYKIFAINKVLSETNPNVKINKRSMVLHSTLLIIQCFSTLLSNIPYSWAP